MSEPFNDEKQEEPLDPAMERVRIKLRRLLFGSTMIMVLGLGSVFAAIFYKINQSDESETAAYSVPSVVTEADLRRASYPLPAGTRIIGVALDGNNLAVTYDGEGGEGGVLLIDVPSWQVFSVMALPQK
ncbi:MAG: fimbrial protein [Hyphomicrobiales bacterium]